MTPAPIKSNEPNSYPKTKTSAINANATSRFVIGAAADASMYLIPRDKQIIPKVVPIADRTRRITSM